MSSHTCLTQVENPYCIFRNIIFCIHFRFIRSWKKFTLPSRSILLSFRSALNSASPFWARNSNIRILQTRSACRLARWKCTDKIVYKKSLLYRETVVYFFHFFMTWDLRRDFNFLSAFEHTKMHLRTPFHCRMTRRYTTLDRWILLARNFSLKLRRFRIFSFHNNNMLRLILIWTWNIYRWPALSCICLQNVAAPS